MAECLTKWKLCNMRLANRLSLEVYVACGGTMTWVELEMLGADLRELAGAVRDMVEEPLGEIDEKAKENDTSPAHG